MSVRVAHARVLVAEGEALAAVARVMQISRQAVYRTPKPRRSPQRRPVTDPVDLAIVVTPAATVPGVIRECVDAKVKGAIIISAGFRETGPDGARLEQAVIEQAHRGRMRILGPNCLGVMRPYSGMNATFARRSARPGNVG
mgnify:CR=1 FL=1